MGVGKGGRSWGPLLGETEEINELAGQLRVWLDEADLTLDQLAGRLTPDHFSGKRPPARSAISARLAGQHLDIAFAEAVVDVCSERHDVAAPRLTRVRHLWQRTTQLRTIVADTEPTGLRLLVNSQQQTIAVHEQLARAFEARVQSDRARADSEKLVILLLQMVHQLTSRITELRGQLGRLRRQDPEPELGVVRGQLTEAESLLEQALLEKAQAESQWQDALELADQAQQRVEFLERELRQLRADPVEAPPEAGPPEQLPTLTDSPNSVDAEFLADITQALSRVHAVNDNSQALTAQARNELAGLELAARYADVAVGTLSEDRDMEIGASDISSSAVEKSPVAAERVGRRAARFPTHPWKGSRAGPRSFARLISDTFKIVVAVVIMLGLPLTIVEVRAINQNAQSVVDSESRLLNATVESALSGDMPLSSYQDTLSRMLTAGHFGEVDVSGQPPLVLNGDPGAVSLFRSTLVTENTYQDGPVVVTVTAMAPRANADDQVRRSLLLIGAVALAVITAATGLAYLQARRLTNQLEDLAIAAERLGSDNPRPHRRRYGITELDRVAEVIDLSADRISAMLGNERRQAVDASHQLRTPLTALSMRMEEIISLADDPQIVRDEAEVALSQLDRLSDVVQRMLATTAPTARRPGIAVPIEVDTVIRQQVHEWRPAYQSSRRGIVVSGERRLVTFCTPGALSQVLSTLLENSLIHGTGTVTIRTRATGGVLVAEVEDEGPGVEPELVASLFERGTSAHGSASRGLAIARELAESEDGQLALVHRQPAVFAVSLPLHSP